MVAQAAWLQEFAHKCKDISKVYRWVVCEGGGGRQQRVLKLQQAGPPSCSATKAPRNTQCLAEQHDTSSDVAAFGPALVMPLRGQAGAPTSSATTLLLAVASCLW